MAALTVIATRRRHTNVLQHMAGYFKDHLDRDSKAELLAAIEDYRRELVPLIVPMTLLRHYVRAHEVSVPGRTAVPRATSQGADASQSRVGCEPFPAPAVSSPCESTRGR